MKRSNATVAAVAIVALVTAGCTSSTSTTQNTDDRATKTVSLNTDCGSAACTGTRDDAQYEIELPAKDEWNGTLVIYSHGYRPTGEIPISPLNPAAGEQPVTTSASAAPSADVAAALTAQGFALAGSAFKTNGWDVTDGVSADEDLYQYFSSTYGRPTRVYLWGASLGGLITQTLAEKHPDWVSGVAPMCGVLGGTNLNLDLALDVAYMVKTLIYPQLKLTRFNSHDEAVANWVAASQALQSFVTTRGALGIASLLAIASASGAPNRTEQFDGSDAISIGQAYAQCIITALGYGTWGRYDIEQRVGGNPSSNADVDYSERISTADRTKIELAVPGQLRTILAALAAGPRVSADVAARTKADALGNPTGDLTVPTLTLHTIDDPLVLSANETVFADRVATKGTGAVTLLKQLSTAPPAEYSTAPYGAGHRNFTKTELVGVIGTLDDWVRRGAYPSQAVVDARFKYDSTTTPAQQQRGSAETGYVPSLTAQRWPAPTR